MKEFATQIITRMIDHPKELKITEEEVKEDSSILLRVWVNADDVGKLLGRRGGNIQAIRTILKAVASKDLKKRLALKLADE
jgi:hypothetical protein